MTAHEPKTSCRDELVADYEEIRRVFVEHLPGGGTVSGMGILLTRGLAAWVDASMSTAPSLARSEPASPKGWTPGRLPGGLKGEVVTILAAMSMSALGEVAR